MNNITVLQAMINTAAVRSVVVEGLANLERRTVNGDHMPSLHVSSDCIGRYTLHIEVNSVWIKVALGEATFELSDVSSTAIALLVTNEHFTVQITFVGRA